MAEMAVSEGEQAYVNEIIPSRTKASSMMFSFGSRLPWRTDVGTNTVKKSIYSYETAHRFSFTHRNKEIKCFAIVYHRRVAEILECTLNRPLRQNPVELTKLRRLLRELLCHEPKPTLSLSSSHVPRNHTNESSTN